MRSLIDETLQQLIPKSGEHLFEMAQYSLEGGKRLRPMLTLAVAEAFGTPLERAIQPACAIELVHTYSLIHDDLPCMDDDDERRGKPTLHKAYPESHAVLTGDYLLTFAFEVIATSPHISSGEKVELIHILSHRSGEKGMIGGQLLDISGDCSLEMAQKKTGALIEAALEFGAVVSGFELAPLQLIGTHLGLAFQIIDDLLDEDGITSSLGKKEAEKMARELHAKAVDEIRSLPANTKLLEELATDMIYRSV